MVFRIAIGRKRRGYVVLVALVALGVSLKPLVSTMRERHQTDLNRSLLRAIAQSEGDLNYDEVKRLIDLGADVNDFVPPVVPLPRTAPQGAAEAHITRPRAPTCMLLALKKYEPDQGWTFDFPKSRANPRIVRLLLEHGAKTGIQGPFFESPLYEACLELDEASARLLLDHGADPNLISEFGPGVSTLSFSMDRLPKLAVPLIEHGADPNAVDFNGESPLMTAIEDDEPDVVAALIRHGANVNYRSPKKRGPRTPLALARFELARRNPFSHAGRLKSAEIINMLTHAGAR